MKKNNIFFTKMSALIFVRVSSPDQSLDNQKAICISYCDQHNLHATNIITHKGTGYKYSYEKYVEKTLVKQLKNMDICHIVFFSIDRAARNIFAFCDIIRQCRTKPVNIHFVVERIEISSQEFVNCTLAATEICSRIVNAQHCGSLLSQKIKNIKRQIREADPNAYVGGRLPVGKYVSVENNRKVLKDYEEFDDLRKLVIHCYIKFTSWSKVESFLNNNNIYCPFSLNGRKEYRVWFASDIKQIVKKRENRNLVHSGLPEQFQHLFSVFNMNELQTINQDFKYKNILDTTKIYARNFVKVEWRHGENNICWIPENYIIN